MIENQLDELSVAEHVLQDPADVLVQLKGRRRSARVDVDSDDARFERLNGEVEYRLEDRIFAREVEIEGAAGDAGGLDDLVYRGRVEATLSKDFFGGLEDFQPAMLSLLLCSAHSEADPSRKGWRFGY